MRQARAFVERAGLLAVTALVAGCSTAVRADPPPPPPTSTTVTVVATTTTTSPPPTTTTLPATTVVAGPPWAVASQTFALVDPSRPTVSHGRTISASRALTTVVFVPAAPGRRPLLIFAHGFDIDLDPYRSLFEYWAARGYVVAAPEFPLTESAVAGANLDEADIDNQPADVRFVTAWLVGPSSPLAARLDPGRVAVAGHSDGAETALGAGDGPPPPGVPAWRAVIAMSGQALVDGPATNPPTLVTQGDADDINPLSYGQGLYRATAPPKYFLLLRGGAHLPPLEAGSRWLPGLEAVTGAFLDAFVEGSRPPSAIPQAAAGYPDVALTAG